MRRPKPVERPLPQIGDFIRRDAYDGRCGALVVRKTGDRYDDVERIAYCSTDQGAQRLAELMNAAKKLASNWQQLHTNSDFEQSDQKAWALQKIVRAVAAAVGAPAPEFPSVDASAEVT